uniref:Gamma-glutamyl hydrolase n=1 Tax=Aegilops tauschii TaxID=37682 RepID=M8BW48_AEGTA
MDLPHPDLPQGHESFDLRAVDHLLVTWFPLLAQCYLQLISLKLSLVNGVLFTGGSVKQAPYFETIKKVFRYVLDKNGAGVAFPLFARCLGFKLVSMTVSKANSSFIQ